MKKIFAITMIISVIIGGTLSIAFAIRPLYTEDCWVTDLGKPAIETGVLLLSTRDNSGFRELITSLKYGLSPNIDISIDLPYFSRGSYSLNYDGLSNGTFKIKYNPINNDMCEGVSFLLGYMVNTGDPNNSPQNAQQHDITPMLIYSKDLGDHQYHFNFGYTFDDEPSKAPAEDFIIYNASIVKPLNKTISIMAETQYNIDTLTGDIVHEIAMGFNYKLNEGLILDAALGCGLTEASSSSNLAFGATILFN